LDQQNENKWEWNKKGHISILCQRCPLEEYLKVVEMMSLKNANQFWFSLHLCRAIDDERWNVEIQYDVIL
jgi:hypothetical protein